MPPFIPLADVIAHLNRSQYEVLPGMERVVGELMVENAQMSKDMIGHEDNGWAPLAESTVREKARLGFVGRISATDPLLRTGHLRDSIEPVVHSNGFSEAVGEVGTDVPYAADLEMGSKHTPPRPFLSPPFMTMEPRAAKALGTLAAQLLVPGYSDAD